MTINMLSNLYVEGYVQNEPQLSYTENKIPKSLLFLATRVVYQKKSENGEYEYASKYVTLPYKIYGNTALFFVKNVIKQQRILISYDIDSYKDDETGLLIPTLKCTSINPLERTEVTTERVIKQKQEKELKQQEESEKENNRIEDTKEVVIEEGYFKHENEESLGYSLSDPDLAF